jgi:F0F1-type ATP synthase epsilon subunit
MYIPAMKPDLKRLAEAVREAEAELDAARGRTAVNAAAKKLQRAREELRSAEVGARMEQVRKPRPEPRR